jgi:polar amino acid transport system substrate-binding protein
VLKQQEMAVALRPADTDLLKAVNDFVVKNTQDGELNKLYHKWLETDLPKML